MPITIDSMEEIFSEAQNDLKLVIAQCKEEFYKPETDRETVKMWLTLPLAMREAITEKNPKLAKSLNDKADRYRKGDMNYGMARTD